MSDGNAMRAPEPACSPRAHHKRQVRFSLWWSRPSPAVDYSSRDEFNAKSLVAPRNALFHAYAASGWLPSTATVVSNGAAVAGWRPKPVRTLSSTGSSRQTRRVLITKSQSGSNFFQPPA
jgi:hypothetical protein